MSASGACGRNLVPLAVEVAGIAARAVGGSEPSWCRIGLVVISIYVREVLYIGNAVISCDNFTHFELSGQKARCFASAKLGQTLWLTLYLFFIGVLNPIGTAFLYYIHTLGIKFFSYVWQEGWTRNRSE